MGLKIVQVDAFADRAFRGNPAAVCILPAARGEPWMQDVAREMNLAETAFLHPENGDYRLRWFTPAVEVALCGHATLASAHVLWEDGYLSADREARFHTQSGVLTARRSGARRPRRRAPRRDPLGGPLQVRLPGRARFRRCGARPQAGSGGARARGRARDHRDGARHDAGLRLRVALLRAPERRTRGSSHGLRSLRLGAVLERAAA